MGYRCQSALKLLELNQCFHIFDSFHPQTVLDLAAAPGGFAQVSLELMKADAKRSTLKHFTTLSPVVIAVDQRPIAPMSGMTSIQGNILRHDLLLQRLNSELKKLEKQDAKRATMTSKLPAVIQTAHGSSTLTLPRRDISLVLHDGVSVVTGQHAFSVTYAQSSMVLSMLLLACSVFAQYGPSLPPISSAPSGTTSSRHPPRHGNDIDHHRCRHVSRPPPLPVCFVTKVLESSHLPRVLKATKLLFRNVDMWKPPTSKKDSLETYLVASHFYSERWRRMSRADGRPTVERRRLAALLSLPPQREDCVTGDRLVWCCLGCGQNRVGCTVCPLCQFDRRSPWATS